MMIAVYLFVFAGFAGMPILPALVIMVVGTILIGLTMERIAYRPLRGGPEVALLLSARSRSARSSRTRRCWPAGSPASRSRSRSRRRSCSRERCRSDRCWCPSSTSRASSSARCCWLLLTVFVTRTRHGPLDAGRRRGPAGGAPDGHQGQPGGHGRVRHRVGAGRGRRATCTPRRRVRSTRTWASRRCSRRSSRPSSAASAACPARCSGRTCSPSWRSSRRPSRASPTSCRRARCRPRSHDLLAQVLPSSLASYRDAFVFVFLILMLLFRPNGILRGRAREETP